MTIGEKLKAWRKRNKIKQKYLGAIINPESDNPVRVWQKYEAKTSLTENNIKMLKKVGIDITYTIQINESN